MCVKFTQQYAKTHTSHEKKYTGFVKMKTKIPLTWNFVHLLQKKRHTEEENGRALYNDRENKQFLSKNALFNCTFTPGL